MNGQAIKGIQIHNQREKESHSNTDIRIEDKHLNYDLIHGDKQVDYKQEIQQVISSNVKSDKKIRKDAVLVTEFLVTSDTSFFNTLSPDEQKRYFETTKDFLAKRYGEQNLIYATVHNDEQTPHMHVGLVPVTKDGRLSAKDVVGNRMQLVKLQDDFNAHVKANGYDLERGVSSDRKHVTMAKFKSMTAFEAEQEASKNYEQTISQIESIQKTSKALEDVQTTSTLGRVILKKEDYDSLLDHAKLARVAESRMIDLQEKLYRSEHEVVQLEDELQRGQDKVRKLYKGIEVRSEEIKTESENIKIENKNINENLNKLVEQKAEPLALELANKHFQEQDVVKKFNENVGKYTNLINKYNQLQTEHTDLQKTSAREIGALEMELKLQKKDYAILKDELNTQTSGLKEENNTLLAENNLLRDQFKQISNEFKAFKERVIEALKRQFKEIKFHLKFNGVEPNHIEMLDKKQERIIEVSMKEIEKPKQQEKESKIEMER